MGFPRKDIEKIYQEFEKELNSSFFYPVRQALKNISKKNIDNTNYLNELGNFVIFYSIPTFNPDLVIVGDNPSWFHKKDSVLALKNLNDVAGKIPKINSYKEHDHTFGNLIIKIFNLIGKDDWIDDVVGLNRFWIQTGGKGTDELKEESNFLKKGIMKDLESICENNTRELVKILNPKLVILFGKKAQNAFPYFHTSKLPDIKFCRVIHPSRGKWRQSASEISTFLKENQIEDF